MVDGNIKPPRKSILVLHHTFFHDAFRYYPNYSMENYEGLKHTRFIARYIIEVGSEIPESEYQAITSKRVLDEFGEKFKSSLKTAGAIKFLEIMSGLIFYVNDVAINSLNLDEGVIAIADKLFSTSPVEYEPVLIVNPSAKNNLVKKVLKFYQATLGKKFTDKNIPFLILDSKEAVLFLEARYPQICDSVKDRMKSAPF